MTTLFLTTISTTVLLLVFGLIYFSLVGLIIIGETRCDLLKKENKQLRDIINKYPNADKYILQ